jgi:hypothetical protein
MIVQEPVQAAIWHCLNHYYYSDAVFLSERLYAEVKSDDSLFLLATAYYRSGQKDHAYHILKERTDASIQCRYLLGICAYDLEKYAEAEAALLQKTTNDSDSLDNVTTEYGDQASFALSLLGNIAAKTERKPRAIDAWRRALKLNPFQWSSFENLCKIGDKPNPQNLFQISGVENLSMCQGSNINNIESVIITNSTPNQDNQEAYITTPQQILVNLNPSLNTNSKICTPDESPLCSQSVLGGRLEGRSSHEPCLPCGATGQRRYRSLPRPTWLPDGRSWVNSSSMSELGIVCRRLTYLWPSDRPEMAQQNTNGWSHTEGNFQNQNQGTDQPVQVDLRVHKAAEVPNVHAPATPKDSLQNDDFWTVRELLWGILIIVISITVLLLVGWALAFKIPHARPK